ncbi:MAG: hypothetical protein LBP27_07070 [Treponema sp.]|jgi:hypothetical protein|nr:hypothetical protein [Treponema sp.]
MTYVTRYETREGKTYRAENAPAAEAGKAKETAAAPETNAGADNNKTPGKPAK